MSNVYNRIYYGRLVGKLRRNWLVMKLIAPFKDHIKSFLFKRIVFFDSYLKSGSDCRIRPHLGSGSVIIPDFINVDIFSIPGVALRCDLSKTLPFKEECAHECYL